MNTPAWRHVTRFSVFFLALFVGTNQSPAADDKEDKGVWIEREEGFLNLLVEKNNFQLHFYDSEKEEKVEPDAVRAVIHYTSNTVRRRETLTLMPEDGEEEVILTSPRAIQPPFQFQILLVLMFDETGEDTENHSLFFHQPVDRDD